MNLKINHIMNHPPSYEEYNTKPKPEIAGEMKVINILCHPPQEILWEYDSPEEYIKRFPLTDYIKIDEYPYCIGFFKLEWHHKLGSYIKKIAPEIEMECWRPYGDKISKVYQKDVDGIKHKVFPSSDIHIKKIGSFSKSYSMLYELKNEIKKNNIIIHFYGCHDSLSTWLVNKLAGEKVPIIVQNLGGWFSWFEWKYKRNPLKLLNYYKERKMLKRVSLYLQASKVEQKFLIKNFPHLKQIFFLNGIDFDEFPLVNKYDARKQLDIDAERKVILYVGRLNSTKGVSRLIAAFNTLKSKIKNLDLYLVGGYKDDEFYSFAIESGAKVIFRSDAPLNLFYAAADLYVMPVTNKFIVNFGGFGIAPIEALALNTKVISPNLIHFEPEEEINKLGVVLNNIDELPVCIDALLNKESKIADTRSIVKETFDIRSNSKKIIKYYEELERLYFSF